METNKICLARSSTSLTRHNDSCCYASLNHLEQRLLMKKRKPAKFESNITESVVKYSPRLDVAFCGV